MDEWWRGRRGGVKRAGETEGARRATGVFPAGAPPRGAGAEVEVVAKAERRRFTAEYKRRIVREADRCTKPGEIGALLRREGLYSSHLTTWRAARDRGELEGLAPKKRGPKAAPPDPRDKKIAELEREIAQLTQARGAGRGVGGGPKKSRGSAGDPVREREVMIETVREVGPATRDRADVRGARPADGDLLPADQAPAAARASAESAARRCPRRSARRCSRCCTSRASSIRPRRRSTPRCSTRDATSARSARCTASSKRITKCASGAISCATRTTPRPSCWPPRPNQVWSWDITKLLGPAKWTYFYLYVILDVFSRYVVGWMVAHHESAAAGAES